MDFKDLKEKLAQLRKDIGNEKTMRKVGVETVDMIKKRTNKGFGVPQSEGPQRRLKKLSEGYKKQRKKLPLGPEATPARSNLNQTGSMVGSVSATSRVKETEIRVTGQNNRKKAQDQVKQGRKFMNLAKNEVNKVVNIIRKEILNDIKKKGL